MEKNYAEFRNRYSYKLFILLFIMLSAVLYSESKVSGIIMPDAYPFSVSSDKRDGLVYGNSPVYNGVGTGVSEYTDNYIFINPASIGFRDSFLIETSIGFLPGYYEKKNSESDLFSTFILSAGIIIPAKFGNFAVQVQYSDSLNNINNYAGREIEYLNKYNSFTFGYAKSINSEFAVGGDTKVELIYNDRAAGGNGEFEATVTGGGGFIYKPAIPVFPKSGFGFQDFTLGLSIINAGVHIVSRRKSTLSVYDFPDLFTFQTGCGFNIYKSRDYAVRFTGDIIIPFFSNFKFHTGFEVMLFRFLFLRAGYQFSLNDTVKMSSPLTAESDAGRVMPFGFGGSFRFYEGIFKNADVNESSPGKKSEKFQLSIDIGARPIHKGWFINGGLSVSFNL